MLCHRNMAWGGDKLNAFTVYRKMCALFRPNDRHISPTTCIIRKYMKVNGIVLYFFFTKNKVLLYS